MLGTQHVIVLIVHSVTGGQGSDGSRPYVRWFELILHEVLQMDPNRTVAHNGGVSDYGIIFGFVAVKPSTQRRCRGDRPVSEVQEPRCSGQQD